MSDWQSKVEALANNIGLKNTSRHMIVRHDMLQSNHSLQYQLGFKPQNGCQCAGKTQSSPDRKCLRRLDSFVKNWSTSRYKYATLCDIAIYSPLGPTNCAVTLSERFRCAIKRKDIYRLVSQHGNNLRTREESKIGSSVFPLHHLTTTTIPQLRHTATT
ncbi:hypothetical protein JOM56_013476, partial [Amanita muscaria]